MASCETVANRQRRKHDIEEALLLKTVTKQQQLNFYHLHPVVYVFGKFGSVNKKNKTK
jgi:hypothetical protein